MDSYGARLRREIGTGFRRNIRYNDDDMGLVMDINFPNNPKKWIRVTPKIARENRIANTVESEAEARVLIQESIAGAQILSGANSVPIVPRDTDNNNEMT